MSNAKPIEEVVNRRVAMSGELARSVVAPMVEARIADLLPDPVPYIDIPASDLMGSPGRFDIIAKYMYARHFLAGTAEDWYRGLYLAHIHAFNKSTEGSKTSPDDFLRSFQELLRSIEHNGFVPERSLFTVNWSGQPITGAHRVAAAACLGETVRAIIIDHPDREWHRQFFLDAGLSMRYADAVAQECVSLDSSSRILVVFPIAATHRQHIVSTLSKYGHVVATKSLRLKGFGPSAFVREVYQDHHWIGTSRDKYVGARRRADASFSRAAEAHVFAFVRTAATDVIREVKESLRHEIGGGSEILHVTDTHEEAIALAGVVFNENSIRHLNVLRPKHLSRYQGLMDEYGSWLQDSGLSTRRADELCISGSAVLSALGLRDCADLDILHTIELPGQPPQGISSHNAHVSRFGLTADSIVSVPENHFCWGGLKYMSLEQLRILKLARGEAKDEIDVGLIDRCLRAQRMDRFRVAWLEFRYTQGRRLRDLRYLVVKDPMLLLRVVIRKTVAPLTRLFSK